MALAFSGCVFGIWKWGSLVFVGEHLEFTNMYMLFWDVNLGLFTFMGVLFMGAYLLVLGDVCSIFDSMNLVFVGGIFQYLRSCSFGIYSIELVFGKMDLLF